MIDLDKMLRRINEMPLDSLKKLRAFVEFNIGIGKAGIAGPWRGHPRLNDCKRRLNDCKRAMKVLDAEIKRRKGGKQ